MVLAAKVRGEVAAAEVGGLVAVVEVGVVHLRKAGSGCLQFRQPGSTDNPVTSWSPALGQINAAAQQQASTACGTVQTWHSQG